MDKKIQRILNDIYMADNSLREKEGELIGIIEEFAHSKPDTKFDENFAVRLRLEIARRMESASENKKDKEVFAVKNFFASRFAFSFVSMAVVVFILTSAIYRYGQQKKENQILPDTNSPIVSNNLSLNGKSGQLQNPNNKMPLTAGGKEMMISYPKEYMFYQNYLQAIGEGFSAAPRHFDSGAIEATVLSVTNSIVCPSATGEICDIEPYPNDYAVIRIDKIINYFPYAERFASQPVEQIGGVETGDGSLAPGYNGLDYSKQKVPEIIKLQEGRNVSVHFTLTARPVKVNYVSSEAGNTDIDCTGNGCSFKEERSTSGIIGAPSASSDMSEAEKAADIANGNGSAGSGDSEAPTGSIIAKKEKNFEPILKDNGYFIFTTKIVPPSEVSRVILPGLKIGDKIRANIIYDGAMVIMGEYEIIQ